MNGWLVAGLVSAFCLASLAAFRLWGPQLLAGLIRIGADAAWKAIRAGLKANRMDPETEARWRDCQRRGGKWDHAKKRCVEPR